MATIAKGNWSFRDPGDDIPNGSTINGGNFSQAVPDTPIMVGKTLTINGGNFVNCRKDLNWTITGGNFAQKSFCGHLHPTWVEKEWIPACPADCPHLIETIEIVGGDDVYVYADQKA